MHGRRIFILFVEKFSYSYSEILLKKKTILVHLWLLRSLRDPTHISPAMLLASSGGTNKQPTDRFYRISLFIFFTTRILTLSWFITSMFPTLTTTRCWWPTPWPCGERRRSGPRRSWYHSWSQCVSCLINFLNVDADRSSQSIDVVTR